MRHGEQRMKSAAGREKKAQAGESRGAACPHALHRDFPLHGAFPLKDMRSQNFVKWPLGNLKVLLYKIHRTLEIQAK